MTDANRPGDPQNPAEQTEPTKSRRNKCGDAALRSKLIPFVLNKLSYREEQEMTVHLCSCAACRKEAEELLDVVSVIHSRKDQALRIVEDELASREVLEQARNVVEAQETVAPPPAGSKAVGVHSIGPCATKQKHDTKATKSMSFEERKSARERQRRDREQQLKRHARQYHLFPLGDLFKKRHGLATLLLFAILGGLFFVTVIGTTARETHNALAVARLPFSATSCAVAQPAATTGTAIQALNP